MKFNCLIPKKMIEFTCIADKCEDSCCNRNWRIRIDKDTYFKYKHSTNKILKDEVVNKIYIIDKNDKNNYAAMTLNNNRCAFLEDGLCSIQRKFGYNYLSNVCKTYPRSFLGIGDFIEISYTLSCPEVVRRLILNESPMEFNIETLEVDSKVEYVNYNPESKFYKHFWAIRSLAIEIMQNRDIDINKRIIMLGMFFKNIVELTDVETCIDRYGIIIKKPEEFINQLDTLEAPENYFKLLFKTLFEIIKRILDKRNDPKLDVLKDLFDIEYEEVFNDFIDVYKNQYKNFEKNTQYIIENIIVHYIYDSKIPLCTEKNTLMDKYNIILLHVFFYRMFIILHYLKYKNFDLKLDYYIQKIGLIFDHDINIKNINDALKKDDIKFAYIIALIIM